MLVLGFSGVAYKDSGFLASRCKDVGVAGFTKLGLKDVGLRAPECMGLWVWDVGSGCKVCVGFLPHK